MTDIAQSVIEPHGYKVNVDHIYQVTNTVSRLSTDLSKLLTKLHLNSEVYY